MFHALIKFHENLSHERAEIYRSGAGLEPTIPKFFHCLPDFLPLNEQIFIKLCVDVK